MLWTKEKGNKLEPVSAEFAKSRESYLSFGFLLRSFLASGAKRKGVKQSPLSPADTSALQIQPQSSTKDPALWSSTDLISSSDPLFFLKEICNNVRIYGLVLQSLICFNQSWCCSSQNAADRITVQTDRQTGYLHRLLCIFFSGNAVIKHHSFSERIWEGMKILVLLITTAQTSLPLSYKKNCHWI